MTSELEKTKVRGFVFPIYVKGILGGNGATNFGVLGRSFPHPEVLRKGIRR